MSDAPRYPDTDGKSLDNQVKELKDYIINLHRYIRYAINNIDARNMTLSTAASVRKVGDIDNSISEIRQDIDNISLSVTTKNGKVSLALNGAGGGSGTIDLTGMVTFNNLAVSDGKTVINADNIKTGTITGAAFWSENKNAAGSVTGAVGMDGGGIWFFDGGNFDVDAALARLRVEDGVLNLTSGEKASNLMIDFGGNVSIYGSSITLNNKLTVDSAGDTNINGIAVQNYCMAYRNTAVSLTAAAENLIGFNSLELAKPSSYFELSGDGYVTCKKAGYVMVWGQIDIACASGNFNGSQSFLTIYKNKENTGIYTRIALPSDSNYATAIFIPYIIKVNANDTLGMRVWVPVAAKTSAGAPCRMFIQYVSS